MFPCCWGYSWPDLLYEFKAVKIDLYVQHTRENLFLVQISLGSAVLLLQSWAVFCMDLGSHFISGTTEAPPGTSMMMGLVWLRCPHKWPCRPHQGCGVPLALGFQFLILTFRPFDGWLALADCFCAIPCITPWLKWCNCPWQTCDDLCLIWLYFLFYWT